MTFKSTLFMEMRIKDDLARTVKIQVDSVGEWVSLGGGRNPDFPQIEIHRDDVESVISMLRKAVKLELPSQP